MHVMKTGPLLQSSLTLLTIWRRKGFPRKPQKEDAEDVLTTPSTVSLVGLLRKYFSVGARDKTAQGSFKKLR